MGPILINLTAVCDKYRSLITGIIAAAQRQIGVY